MTRMLCPAFLVTLFVFASGHLVFATEPLGPLQSSSSRQTPKILKLSEIQFDTQAVGFSVFRGVEPEKFDVQLRNVFDAGWFSMIVARISGGPMETPLEKIGAVAGMSGSPIFVGDCDSRDECVSKA